jgi:hypothetical protein
MTSENPELDVIDNDDGTVTLKTALGTIHVSKTDTVPNGILVATTDFDMERKDEHADDEPVTDGDSQ